MPHQVGEVLALFRISSGADRALVVNLDPRRRHIIADELVARDRSEINAPLAGAGSLLDSQDLRLPLTDERPAVVLLVEAVAAGLRAKAHPEVVDPKTVAVKLIDQLLQDGASPILGDHGHQPEMHQTEHALSCIVRSGQENPDRAIGIADRHGQGSADRAIRLCRRTEEPAQRLAGHVGEGHEIPETGNPIRERKPREHDRRTPRNLLESCELISEVFPSGMNLAEGLGCDGHVELATEK